MSRTIGKRLPKNLPKGDTVQMCGHCGANWYASKMYLDGAGTLTCPDEGPGLDAVTLDEMNAQYEPKRPELPKVTGHYVNATGISIHFTTAEEAGL